MDLKLVFTKRKILALILIFFLLSLCFYIARRGTSITDNPTPLSSVNIEAMFYVTMPETGEVVCVGDGLINSTDEASGQEEVNSKIVTAPDNSSYLGYAYHVDWTSIKHADDGYRVYGETVEGAPPKRTGAYISVKDFGAVGDGVTDDTLAIKAALKNGENSEVYFPAGTYAISSVVYIPSNTHVYGDSDNSVIIAREGTGRGATMIRVVDASNILVEDICISGNSSVNFENMNSIDGIHLFDTGGCDNVVIRNCHFKDNVYCAIRNMGTNNLTIDHCLFTNVDCGYITLGSNDTYNVYITNNIFDGHGASEPVSLMSSGTHTNVHIENNIMSNKTYGYGIKLFGISPNKDIVIKDNTIDSCASGIEIHNTSNLTVSGNRITNTTTGMGLRFWNCSDTVIDNNYCYNIPQDGLDVKDCSNLTITNLQTINCGQGSNDFFNVRFRGDYNTNITFKDSRIEYDNVTLKKGLVFSCNTDIKMDNIEYINSNITLTKNTSNMIIDVPSNVKIIDKGISNVKNIY